MRNKIIAALIVTIGIVGIVEAFVYKPQPTKAKSITTTSQPVTTQASNTQQISQPAMSASHMHASGAYKDGQYTGDTIDVGYGPVQMALTISGGRITDVQFLQTPSDRQTSQMIASAAKPYLKQETLTAQSANIDIVSGATATSEGYIQSLQTALAQASRM